MKKIETNYELLKKFDVSDYKRGLPFAQESDFKFFISLYNPRKDTYARAVKKCSLSEAVAVYGPKRIVCILVDEERGEANMVLEDKK